MSSIVSELSGYAGETGIRKKRREQLIQDLDALGLSIDYESLGRQRPRRAAGIQKTTIANPFFANSSLIVSPHHQSSYLSVLTLHLQRQNIWVD